MGRGSGGQLVVVGRRALECCGGACPALGRRRGTGRASWEQRGLGRRQAGVVPQCAAYVLPSSYASVRYPTSATLQECRGAHEACRAPTFPCKRLPPPQNSTAQHMHAHCRPQLPALPTQVHLPSCQRSLLCGRLLPRQGDASGAWRLPRGAPQCSVDGNCLAIACFRCLVGWSSRLRQALSGGNKRALLPPGAALVCMPARQPPLASLQNPAGTRAAAW